MKILKFKTWILVLAGLICFIGAKSKLPKSHGAPLASSGAPGELTCAQSNCHEDGSYSIDPSVLSLDFAGTGWNYAPDTEYQMRVNIDRAGYGRFGFQIVALRDSDNANVGTWVVDDPTQTHETYDPAFIDRAYMTHTTASTMAAQTGQNSWEFSWTAPSTAQGDVRFYVAALASNNDGEDTGDEVFIDSFVIGDGANCGTAPSITNLQETINELSVNWSATSGCTSYQIDLQEVGGALQSVNSSATSYVFDNLTQATEYNVRISCDCGGGTLRSNWQLATTLCPDNPSLAVTNVGSVSAELDWDVASCESISIHYREENEGAFTTISGSGTSRILGALQPGKDYEVYLECTCGPNTLSSRLERFSTSCEFDADVSVSTYSTAADVSWNTADGCTTYQLWYRQQGTGSWQSDISQSSPVTFEGLNPDTSYEVKVDCACGSNTISSALTPFSTICAVEAFPQPVEISDQHAVIEWPNNVPCDSYSVKYRIVGANYFESFVVNGNSANLDALFPDSDYEFTTTCNCNGTTVESAPIYFTTSSCDYLEISFASVDDANSEAPLLSFQVVNNHPEKTVATGISAIDFTGPFSVSSSYQPIVSIEPGGLININTVVTAANPIPGATVSIDLAFGNGSGEDLNCAASRTFLWQDNGNPPEPANGYARVKLKTYLSGPYLESSQKMSTALNSLGLLPTSQPYNVAPYYYTGTESVSTIPSNVVDWVLLEVLSKETISLLRKACFIDQNGNLLDVSGGEGVVLPLLSTEEEYYYIIRHRNHLDIMSRSSWPINNESPYDLSLYTNVKSGITQMDRIVDNLAAMIAGEADGNGIKSYQDYNIYTQHVSAIYELIPGDFNMDGLVTVADYNAYKEQVNVIGISEIRY